MENEIVSLEDLKSKLMGGDEMLAAITQRIAEVATTERHLTFRDVDEATNDNVECLNNLQANQLRKLGYTVEHNKYTELWTVYGW